MEINNRLSLLKDLRSLLLDQRIADCRLMHETTQHDRDSQLPLSYMIGDEKHYKRLGLCSSTKKQHLGCAHTNYCLTLSSKIIAFAEMLPDLSKQLEYFHLKMKELEMEIITTDVKKSAAEIAISQARESKNNIQHLLAQSNTISEQHSVINNKIREEVDSLLSALDIQIKLIDT